MGGGGQVQFERDQRGGMKMCRQTDLKAKPVKKEEEEESSVYLMFNQLSSLAPKVFWGP